MFVCWLYNVYVFDFICWLYKRNLIFGYELGLAMETFEQIKIYLYMKLWIINLN